MPKPNRIARQARYTLPPETLEQIDWLADLLKMTKSGVVARAVASLHRNYADDDDSAKKEP